MKKKYISLFLYTLIQIIPFLSFSQTITTFAGSGTQGYSGDSGQATAAELYRPYGLCFDTVGNLYFAEDFNNVLRKVTPTGIISTVAGNGTPGYAGDGSAATAALLNSPNGITIDKGGNIYIADGQNSVIRKINPIGIITTIAGNGTQGYSGDGGPATSANLKGPSDVIIDNNLNIFIADAGNHCIRKINPAGIISTIAGNGTHGFSGDGGPATAALFYTINSIVFDKGGNLYVADAGNLRIRKINTSGIVTTIAGIGINTWSGDGGPATAAGIGSIPGIAVDTSDNIYIADGNHGRVRKIDHSGGIITTIAGDGTLCGFGGDGGPATNAQLCNPYKITIDKNGRLYFSDAINNRIRRLTAPTAINDINNVEATLILVPNPSQTGLFNVKVVSNLSEEVNIVVTNMAGIKFKEVQATTNVNTDIQLNVGPGIYFISIITTQWIME